MVQGEWVLGDGIYDGEPQLLVKYNKPNTGGSADRQRFNDIIDLYRARVEHLMHEVCIKRILLQFDNLTLQVKDHAAFHTVFRGSHALLGAFMHMTINTTAEEMRRYPRYEGFGNWSHF
jgi:hypothetical protein